MDIIEDLDTEELRVAFETATDPKATKRLMVALAYKDGVPVDTLSDRYGISRSTIYSWLNRFREEPIAEAVSDESRPGRPPSLDEAERVALDLALDDPPNRCGFDAERWTPRLVRRFVRREFGVEYSIGHVRRLLREHRREGRNGG